MLGGVAGGLIFGLVEGLINGVIVGIVAGLVGGLAGGLVGELRGELARGLITVLANGPGTRSIKPVERLGWSWSEALRTAHSNLIVSLLGALIFGLVFQVIYGLGLLSMLLFGLVLVLLFGLVGGLDQQAIGVSQRPNQGIIRSALSALLSGLLGTLLFGLMFGLAVEPGLGLSVGSLFGLLFGLNYGGTVVIQHSTLRLLLALSSLAPLRYGAFLDHAAGRVLLRRVGGGWVFVHRLLLDYFAGLAPGLGMTGEEGER